MVGNTYICMKKFNYIDEFSFIRSNLCNNSTLFVGDFKIYTKCGF